MSKSIKIQECGHLEIVKLLIENGANTQARDNEVIICVSKIWPFKSS